MKESEPIKRRLLNIREVAEYTGLSVHTLYTMVSQRRIPYVKAGRLTKFDLKTIDAWIERNSVKTLGTNQHECENRQCTLTESIGRVASLLYTGP